jgi:hypothetical protein
VWSSWRAIDIQLTAIVFCDGSSSPIGTLTLQQVEKGESILMQIYQLLRLAEGPSAEQLSEMRTLSQVRLRIAPCPSGPSMQAID